MKPACYQSVGGDAFGAKFEEGYSVKYNEEHVSAVIKTDKNLQNPSFAANFKLSPGSAALDINGGKVTKLALTPNLAKFDTSLNIFPLDGGKFTVNINKKCPETGALFNFSYDSSVAKGALAVSPVFDVKGIHFDGKFIFKGVDPNKPLIHIDHLHADWKNIRLCTCTVDAKDKADQEFRMALFANLKKANAGSLLHFSRETKDIKEIDVFAMTKIKNLDLSVIGGIKNKTLEVRLGGPLCKNCPCTKFGAKVAYAKAGMNVDLGLKTCVKGASVKTNVSVTKAQEIKHKIVTAIEVPVKGLGNAYASLKIDDVTAPTKFAYGFGIELKQ